MKLKVKNQLTVTRIAILGTEKLNTWKSNELDLIALRLGQLRSDLWNEFGSLKAWGISKFEIDKQLRTSKDKYQLPAKLWDSTLWEIHYTTDIQKAEKKTEGKIIGCDRGYTEVYATSSNDGARFLGNNFGKIQTEETDYRTAKQVKRNKIKSVFDKSIAKADRIKRNNLGKIKWNNRETSFKGRIQTIVFTATHDLMTDAIKVAFQDLTEALKSKKPLKKRMKRNVSSWCKGIVADGLKQVSTRTGCAVVSVNSAYTSQLDSRFATLTGSRNGDKFTGHDGVVMHSDTNAADNILARMSDVKITRYMKHSNVKVILLERTCEVSGIPNSGNRGDNGQG